MSIDRSLKLRSALVRHRNVLTRTERVERLKKEEKWLEDSSLLGLPKVANRKMKAKKAAKEAAPAGVEGEAAPAAEAGAAPAAAAGAPKAKGAAPAAAAAPKAKPEGKPKAAEGKK